MTLAIIAFILSGGLGLPPGACAAPASRAAQFFLEAIPPVERDSVASVRLCLDPGTAGIGSYAATLTFDAAVMRASSVEVSGGMQAANANVAGTVRLAGAAPAGFARGPLATIRFRLAKGKTLDRITLTLVEANDRGSQSVLADAKVRGNPASDRSRGVVQRVSATPAEPATAPSTTPSSVPRIDSIRPRGGAVESESVLDVTIYGRGFAPSGNVVSFDAATVTGLISERAGTVVRFAVPTVIPAHDTVALRRLTPGKYLIRLRTPAGTSNAVTFTVRDEDR